jgi:hypothetical protein
VQPRGSVNPITVLMLMGVAGALWWAIIFGPVYLDNMTLREALDVGLHAPGDDENKRDAVLKRINFGGDAVGSHTEEDANGNPVEVRGLGLTSDNVTVVSDREAGVIRISVDYSRDVRMAPSQKVRTVTFHIEKEGPLSQ